MGRASRWAALCVAVPGALAMSIVPAVPAAGQVPSASARSLVPSSLTVENLRAGGYVVAASAEAIDPAPEVQRLYAYAFASAQRRVRIGDDRMSVVSEHFYYETPPVYHFDPVDWKASVKGSFRTFVYREIWERDGRDWKVVSVRRSPGRGMLDLTWRGVGDTRVTPNAGVGFTYALPPGCGPVCPYARATFSRDAVVSGTLRFQGVGLSVRLPRQAAGVMTWWA